MPPKVILFCFALLLFRVIDGDFDFLGFENLAKLVLELVRKGCHKNFALTLQAFERFKNLVQRLPPNEYKQSGLALIEVGTDLLHYLVIDSIIGEMTAKGSEAGSKDRRDEGK